MINEQIEDNASHDFDVISHESCSYDDPGKGLQVDVEKVVSSVFGGDQVNFISSNKYPLICQWKIPHCIIFSRLLHILPNQDDYIIDGDFEAEVVEFTTKSNKKEEDERFNEI